MKKIRFRKLLGKIAWNILFKKVPKKNEGRCVTCDASNLCGRRGLDCYCSIEQQYELKHFY